MSDVILDFYVGDTIKVGFRDCTRTDSDGIAQPIDLTVSGTKIQASCSLKPNGTPTWVKKNSANGGDETQISVTGPQSLLIYATNAESAAMLAKHYYLDVVVLWPDGTRPTIGYVVLNMMWRPTQGNVPV